MQLKITVIVSAAGTDNEYCPFKSVVLPMAVPPMRTVANSMGALSPSVTLPDILTLAAETEIADNVITAMITVIFILFVNEFIAYCCRVLSGTPVGDDY